MPFNALLLLFGMAIVQQLPQLKVEYLIIASVISLLLAYYHYWRGLLLVAAILWAMLFAYYRLSQQLAPELEGIIIAIEGTIDSLPEQYGQYSRFDFIISRANNKLPHKIRLSAYNFNQPLKAGQQWAFTVILKRPHSPLNADSFDYERYLFEQGIGATGSIRPQPKALLMADPTSRFSFMRLRQSLSDKLDALTINKISLALIKALTLGDSRAMTPAQWQLLRDTGTTHLWVISGSHIGLIAGLVYALTRILWVRTGILRYAPQPIAAGFGLFAALSYAGLTGFDIPIQRASIMLCCAMLSLIWQRQSRPLHVLSLALCVVLLYDPLAVLSPGCYLSFASVALILYALAGRLRPPHPFYAALKVHGFTFLGLAPLLLGFFAQWSLSSLLANVIAVPVISVLIVPLALCALPLLYLCPSLAHALFFIADYSLQILWGVLTQLASTPLMLTHAKSEPWLFALTLIAVLVLLAPRGIPARWLGLVLLLPLAFSKNNAPVQGAIRLTVLDVGQGLAVVIQTAKHWLVYDTGGKFSARTDSGLTVLLPFLQARGVTQVDSIIISHGDNDHIGGAASLLQAMPTTRLLSSVPQQPVLRDYAATACYAGQTWHYDGVRFTVLSPAPNTTDSDNNRSCVVQIHSQYGTVLLTGDIEATAEADLVARYADQLRAEVLIAPHHGSNSSSTQAFLQAVAPKTVLIAAGYHNSFKHPHAKVLARYQAIQAQWFNTADSGAITLQLDNAKQPIINSTRQTQGHYWNSRH